MKISAQYKFAFLCNPKCGSTSVEKAIDPYCESGLGGAGALKHINARTFNRHILPILHRAGLSDQFETFCIIREPVERLYSWYKYQTRPLLRDQAHSKYTGGISFEQFVEGYISKDKPPYCATIGTQARFINLDKGRPGVDHVFRLDRMDAVAAFLGRKIGKPVTIEHYNPSPDSQSGRKRHLFRPGSWFPKKPSAKILPSPMEISDELLARLKSYLAADYRIYNSISG